MGGRTGAIVPTVELGDRQSGPTIGLIAGVHGCEYSSMLGLRRFLAGLDARQLRGRVVAVPIANLAAFEDRRPFTVPHDDLNLNRQFPGDPGGSFTPRLARLLFDEVIRQSDAVVDLHCGDQVEALEPFALYDASPVEEASRALAVAYGLPYAIRSQRSDSPIAGTSSAAAAEIGVPAITAEAGGCGLVDEASVQAHVDGLYRVFAHLGVLPPAVAPAPVPPTELHRFVWLRAPQPGWWEPRVAVGSDVAAGDTLGTVSSLVGDEEAVITAPEAGVPLFITTSPATVSDGLLLGLGVR
jgi:predicted deacylase